MIQAKYVKVNMTVMEGVQQAEDALNQRLVAAQEEIDKPVKSIGTLQEGGQAFILLFYQDDDSEVTITRTKPETRHRGRPRRLDRLDAAQQEGLTH